MHCLTVPQPIRWNLTGYVFYSGGLSLLSIFFQNICYPGSCQWFISTISEQMVTANAGKHNSAPSIYYFLSSLISIQRQVIVVSVVVCPRICNITGNGISCSIKRLARLWRSVWDPFFFYKTILMVVFQIISYRTHCMIYGWFFITAQRYHEIQNIFKRQCIQRRTISLL